ncbi:MAG: alpha/beta fold hydrolase [Deltaproteobacteria bacterium]|nr:alpha/beta fold hydrolase [Deltaproteobacteria bacterium]
MDREKIAFAAMKPIDMALGAVIATAKATGTFEPFGERFYGVARKVLNDMYTKNNALAAEGLELVPASGGVVFASNHQSWNDVQVIGATCPRRLRFLAKSEFETWPILRHLIALSDSPFIRRGGDSEGMANAIHSLREGKALMIFPEGTIPGEEDIGRHEVEPETGLLRGHTGAVRLAIEARVPIVPIGVSGTGASFPPEVYPRLEILETPKPVPVTVRYGRPMSFAALHGKAVSGEDLRRHTRDLMLAISGLVDHSRNYVPLRVPIPPLPKVKKLGVLLLHGFTSSVRTVDGMVPLLQQSRLPFRMPVLRGHGTTYTDMEGVTAQDWYDDAEKALLDLAREVDKVVVVGLSMGGLLALNLGIRQPDKIAGIVTWAAALRFRDPLAPLSGQMAKVIKSWPAPEAFNDRSLKAFSENYPKFMTSAFVSLFRYAQETERRLPELRLPVCVLHSKGDQVIDPLAANLIYRDVSSPWREIHWFRKSGHEMGQDLEREAVFARTMEFIAKFRP